MYEFGLTFSQCVSNKMRKKTIKHHSSGFVFFSILVEHTDRIDHDIKIIAKNSGLHFFRFHGITDNVLTERYRTTGETGDIISLLFKIKRYNMSSHSTGSQYKYFHLFSFYCMKLPSPLNSRLIYSKPAIFALVSSNVRR